MVRARLTAGGNTVGVARFAAPGGVDDARNRSRDRADTLGADGAGKRCRVVWLRSEEERPLSDLQLMARSVRRRQGLLKRRRAELERSCGQKNIVS